MLSTLSMWLALGLAIGASATSEVALAANCSRISLMQVTDRYITAQSTGQINYLKALGDIGRITYIENQNATDITKGLLAQPLKIDHTRSTYDSTACATYSELIVTDPKHPYVIGTQIRMTDGNITRIESIVSNAGDWLFSARHTLHYALGESWDRISREKRDNRTTLQAAADAYLDLFKDNKTVVPWGYPCARLEGGLYTAKGLANDTCNVGVPSGLDLRNRRYVIDEQMGSVDVMLTFGNSSLPDSHEFRVEGGKLRYVHTITACFKPNCGMKVPDELSKDPGY